jgi:hypothetical protein
MIKLTRLDSGDVTWSAPLWVRPEAVIGITPELLGYYPGTSGKVICTAIHTERLQWYVRETPEEILRMMK